jgi:hypothetical protein
MVTFLEACDPGAWWLIILLELICFSQLFILHILFCHERNFLTATAVDKTQQFASKK